MPVKALVPFLHLSYLHFLWVASSKSNFLVPVVVVSFCKVLNGYRFHCAKSTLRGETDRQTFLMLSAQRLNLGAL